MSDEGIEKVKAMSEEETGQGFSGLIPSKKEIKHSKEVAELRVKYNGRLAELRQCEEDRNKAWQNLDALREVVNRMEQALLEIVMGRSDFQGPSLDYMQGYRDGQEHQARVARKALGHNDPSL